MQLDLHVPDMLSNHCKMRIEKAVTRFRKAE